MILIVDTETTGLENAEICEMAATLYSTNPKGAIASISTLLPIENNPTESINGISPKLANLADYEQLNNLSKLSQKANYATAFNAEFDKPFWDTTIDLPWFCAMRDFDWEYHKERFTLIELALWLGIGVATAHRAGDDVRLLVECFNRCSHFEERLEQAITRSQSPQIKLKAIVNYDNCQLAKDAGFEWDYDQKIWVKKVRECDRLNFLDQFNFETDIITTSA
ncbi:3'-5' exonuclease [Microcoleus sp. herbarium14]|uniref:3'-5' exonuclease n=1 Tax=Microcoleus sp. herbarium14 TaxID=3055439 RepID=UPI002FD59F05